MTQAPPALPLLFSFREAVFGKDFVAGVEMHGRALLETEQVDGCDETWISGIAPVGIGGGGSDRGSAFTSFRKAWTSVLFDFADKAKDFAEFKALCEEFLRATQPSMTKVWLDAVRTIRKEKYKDPSLSTGDADKSVKFKVLELSTGGGVGGDGQGTEGKPGRRKLNPSLNMVETDPSVAA